MADTENEYLGLSADRLAWAVNHLMIGGNSISSALIGLLGPRDFTTWGDFEEAQREIIERLGDKWYEAYEMWVMWFACKNVRKNLLGY